VSEYGVLPHRSEPDGCALTGLEQGLRKRLRRQDPYHNISLGTSKGYSIAKGIQSTTNMKGSVEVSGRHQRRSSQHLWRIPERPVRRGLRPARRLQHHLGCLSRLRFAPIGVYGFRERSSSRRAVPGSRVRPVLLEPSSTHPDPQPCPHRRAQSCGASLELGKNRAASRRYEISRLMQSRLEENGPNPGPKG